MVFRARRTVGVVATLSLWMTVGCALGGQWVISGNETKIDLTGGAPRRVVPEGPDSLTLMDFSVFPPRVTQVMDVPNTVIGPPSNLPPGDPNHTDAGRLVMLERAGRTYRVRKEVAVGRIPEGVAFSPDGRLVLVQCHPDREIRIYEMRRGRVRDTGRRVSVPGFPSSLRASP